MPDTTIDFARHRVDLEDTDILEAVREMIEDELAKIVRHSREVTTEPMKPSTITLKVAVLPANDRQQFLISVTNSTALAPKRAFTATVVGGEGRDGKITVQPVQFKLPGVD